MNSSNKYLIPEKAWNLMMKARRNLQPVYIYGMSTYGKTELVNNFFQGKKFVYYSPVNGDSSVLFNFDSYVNPKRKIPMPVVFDDLQFETDDKIQKKIFEIADRKDVWPIFIARSPLLGWLVPYYTLNNFVIISEEELALTEAQMQDYFFSQNIAISKADLRKLQNYILGNPYALFLAESILRKDKNPYSLHSSLGEIFAQFVANKVSPAWSPELKEFFMTLSQVDSFTVELAEYLTGNPYSTLLINKARDLGNFLFKENDVYTFRPIVRSCFRFHGENYFGRKKLNEIAIRAGHWYEDRNDFTNAITVYSRASYREGVVRILKKNSELNPGTGQFIELSKYYFELDKSEISKDVPLMSGMSMVSSLLLRHEESEYWYEKIKEKTLSNNPEERNRAFSHIFYLDIALPHRKIDDIFDVIKKFSVFSTKNIKIPEFSVTSNMPSVLNGGKDFSEWIFKDRKIINNYKKELLFALGRNGTAFINLALAESFLEKAEKDVEILALLSRGQIESEINDSMEMSFVALGLYVRFYISLSQIDTAMSQFSAFEKLCNEKKCIKLLPNVHAMQCRIDLYRADTLSLDFWLDKYAPDENFSMSIFDRYEFLTKIRCYIAKGRLLEAYSLKEKIKLYAEKYNRNYILVECNILGAIIEYRKKESETWQNSLQEALLTASKYKIVRIFSDEGVLLEPLLLKIKDKILNETNIDKKWFHKVMRETGKMSSFYPNYCFSNVVSRNDFSENAREILRLQVRGLSTEEIAKQLNLKLENVRYHIKKNYKKLGVNSKSEAIIIAKEMFLL